MWKCDSARLMFLQVGQAMQTTNGFLVAKVCGWYCPIEKESENRDEKG